MNGEHLNIPSSLSQTNKGEPQKSSVRQFNANVNCEEENGDEEKDAKMEVDDEQTNQENEDIEKQLEAKGKFL